MLPRRLTVVTALLVCGLLVCAAQDKRPLSPQTRTQLEIVVAHVEATLAKVEDGETKDSLRRSLVEVHAQLSGSEAAKQTVEAMGQGHFRDFALGRLALSQAEAGEFLQARKTAGEIQSSYERGRALGWVARKQAKTGQLSEALATVTEIDDPQARSHTLLLLGLAFSRQGDWVAAENTLAQAAEAARQMESADQAWQLLNIAEAQKLAEQKISMQQTLAWARSAIEQVQGVDTRDRLLARLAALQTKLGLEGEAYVIESSIEDPQHQWEPRAARAAKQAQQGDSAGALSIIDSADAPVSEEEENARAWALESVVQAHTNAGDFEAARAVINQMPANHPARAHRLAYTAWAMWRRGRDQEATQTFDEAIETAARIEDPGMRGQALRIVAGSLGEADQTERALGVVERIDQEHERLNALSSIALSQGRRGEMEAALDWILQLEPPAEQARALLGLTHGLITRDQFGPPRPRKSPRPTGRPN